MVRDGNDRMLTEAAMKRKQPRLFDYHFAVRDPENGNVHPACGRDPERSCWTWRPAEVTCDACKALIPATPPTPQVTAKLADGVTPDSIGRRLLEPNDVENVVTWARDPDGTAGSEGSYVYRSAQVISQVADERDRLAAELEAHRLNDIRQAGIAVERDATIHRLAGQNAKLVALLEWNDVKIDDALLAEIKGGG